jgi:hypothetical protein
MEQFIRFLARPENLIIWAQRLNPWGSFIAHKYMPYKLWSRNHEVITPLSARKSLCTYSTCLLVCLLRGLSPRANYTDERPLFVCEVIANFCRQRVSRGQRDESLRPYCRFSRQEPLLFYQVAPQLYSRGWVDPVPDPLLFFLVLPGIEPGPQDL